MKKLLVAALMVLLASPAFAAIQNVKVSGDITTSFVDRNNFDLGLTEGSQFIGTGGAYGVAGNGTFEGLKSQNVFLTQTRLRVDADLSDNVSTTVGLINERAWNAESSNDTNVQLYLASVTMRELLYSPLTVTVGRQTFIYGNGFILGNGPGNQATGNLQYVDQDLSMRSSEDGIKAVLDYKPLTIDLLYFKNEQTVDSIRGFGNLTSGQSSDVFGYNLNYQLGDSMNTVVEQYMFAEINGSGIDDLGPGSNKGDTLYVPGLRASTNPIKGLNVQGEVAMQFGNVEVPDGIGHSAGEHRDAFGAQLMASYALPVLEKYKPTVNASYTYVSGDKDSIMNVNDTNGAKIAKTESAWDPMFQSQGVGTIYNSIYPLTNMNVISLGASANPLEDVTTAFTWTNLWAADRYTAQNPLFVFQPNEGPGMVAMPASTYTSTKKDARGLGNEYDANITYNYTEDVTFGVSLGWYVPGSAIAGAEHNTASQAIADVAVKF
jgi:hypothetical protein